MGTTDYADFLLQFHARLLAYIQTIQPAPNRERVPKQTLQKSVESAESAVPLHLWNLRFNTA